ncbi:type II secretion system F family protein [Kitasatospora sp. NPDC051853]|uniref:type II secretion system F family protein n=1 Tax=Kitasatospora sp. NPDC051853 TaxID=3364058 RepID=UPI0037A53CEC
MTPGHILVAAGAGGVAVGLWLGLRRRAKVAVRAHSLLGAAVSSRDLRGRMMALAIARPPWLVVELLLLPVGLVAGQLTDSPVPVLLAAAGVVPLRRWRARRRRAAEARRRASAVIELCEGLAAELRSGATAGQALIIVMGRPSGLRAGLGAEPAARLTAGRYGADVPAALRLIAELPGGRGAAALAACWQVTAESGTGLAPGLDQLADALRAERALVEEITGELAGPRTTIAVLAALPVVGLMLGAALGADPVHILLHTPAGLACLVAGALLEAAGLAWTARIVRAAEDAPGRRERNRRRGGTGDETGEPWEERGRCGISRVRADGRARDQWVGRSALPVQAEAAW